MKKNIGILLLLVSGGFIAIQFFQPEKNLAVISENHFLKKEKVPEKIQLILKNACLDCHSNTTSYLWYNKVAPVSWLVHKHVAAGKEELNLSDWGKNDAFAKIAILEDIVQEMERKTMPLKSYKIMHPKARLSEKETFALRDWTSGLSEELLKKLEITK